MRKALFAITLACIALPAAAQYGGYDGPNRDAYRKGYDDGYQRGFEKGLEEGRRGAPPQVIVAPPPAPPQGPNGPIALQSAVYGDGSRSCTAMRFVGSRVNGRRSASFEVTNDMCGDPAPGKRKSLDVAYYCGNYAKTASANEHRSIYLDCNSP